jgi:hypothetical protein
MKSSVLLFPLAAFALVYFVTSFGPGANAATKAPPPPPDMRKMIKSVNIANSTIDIIYMHSHMVHTYKIDGVTEVKVNNQDGKLADIKPGMVVDDYLERDNDDLDGISLSGYGTTPAAAKPATTKPAPPKPTPAPAPTQ